MEWIIFWLIAANTAAFLLFGVDKLRAIHSRWRIPEAVLLTVAVLGGGVGAFFGMEVFRHKTRHAKFRIFIPLCILLNLLTALLLTLNLPS